MERIAFMMRLRPGCETEYERRHDAIWQEMLDLMTLAGIHNYSIFLHETMLFNVFECDDWAATSAVLGESGVSARWREYMRDLMVEANDGTLEQTPFWRSVFFFQGRSLG